MKKIANHLFFEKFLVTFAVILQLSICIGFVNYFISANRAFYVGYKDTFNFEDAQYFVSAQNSILMAEEFEESLIEFIYPEISLNNYNIYSFKTNTLNRLVNSYILKGNYQHGTEENFVNCVVVGDKSILNKTITVKINNRQNINFYVCGILKESAKKISKNVSGTFVTPYEIFENYDLNKINIICLSDDVSFLYQENSLSNAIVYFGENSFKAEHELSSFGQLFTMEQLRNNINIIEYYTPAKVFGYLGIGIGFVGIISIICMFVVNVKNCEEIHYSINQTNLEFKDVKGVIKLYMSYFFLTLIPLSFLLFKILQVIYDFGVPLKTNFINILFTLIIILTLYMLNYVVNYFVLNKSKE